MRLRSAVILPAAVMALWAGLGAAHAQTASFEDLRALRFYIQQDDSTATQAELRRLRLAFPDWRPPSDLRELLAAPSVASVDEGAIWRQIERRDYATARQLIDQGRAAQAGWTPPSEMLRVLETNEAQDGFDAAVAARNAPRAIETARRAPQLMSCERINNAWLLADMYVLAGQKPAALTTYRNTLQSCTSLAQMQPTLEKSSAVSSPAQLRESFALARRYNPGAQAQLDALERSLLGGGATPAAAPAPATPAAPRQAAASPQATPAPSGPPPVTPASALPLRGDGRLA